MCERILFQVENSSKGYKYIDIGCLDNVVELRFTQHLTRKGVFIWQNNETIEMELILDWRPCLIP